MKLRLLEIFFSVFILVLAMPILCVYAENPDTLLVLPPNLNNNDSAVNRTSTIGQWTIVPYDSVVSNTESGSFSDGILKKATSSAGGAGILNFYVPQEKTYRIFVRVKDFSPTSGRCTQIKVDNGDAMVFASRPDLASFNLLPGSSNPLPDGVILNSVASGGTWYWDGGEEHHSPVILSAGWHTLTINNIGTTFTARFDSIVLVEESSAFPKPLSFDSYLSGLKDIEAPSFNGTLTEETNTTSTISFSWSASDSVSGIAQYYIYRDGTIINSVDSTVTDFTDEGLSQGVSHSYTVRAIDRLGQYSEVSETLSTTAKEPDTQPPAWAEGAKVIVNSQFMNFIDISWTAATDNFAVENYEIYKNTVDTDNLICSVSSTKTQQLLSNLPNGNIKLLVVAKDGAGLTTLTPIEIDITVSNGYYCVLRALNFSFPASSGWLNHDTNPTAVPYSNILYNSIGPSDSLATATMYAPKDGKYVVWANGRDYATNSPGTRYFCIGIDGELNSYAFASKGIEGYSWYRGFEINLTKGWHTVSVKPGGAYMRCMAICITDDLVTDLSDITNYDAYLAPLEDYSAPVFTNGLTCRIETLDSIIINWSAAVDVGTGIKQYALYCDDILTAELDSSILSYTLTGLNALSHHNVRVEALDGVSNKISISSVVDVKFFNTSKFIIADSTGENVSTLSELSGKGKVRAQVTLTNSSLQQKPIFLGICVYKKSNGKLVASAHQSRAINAGENLTDYYAEVALPLDFSSNPLSYYVYAFLWDSKQNASPQEQCIMLNN